MELIAWEAVREGNLFLYEVNWGKAVLPRVGSPAWGAFTPGSNSANTAEGLGFGINNPPCG